MHFTPLRPVSVPHGGRLPRIYKLFVIACASVRRLAVAPPPQRADLAAGSASTAAAAERDWRGTCPPSTPSLQFTVLVHSSTRASVRSSGAQSLLPAREASLQAPEIPMRASSAFVSQDETSTADGQSQRQSQSEVCYRDYISTSVDPHEQYAYLRERSARDGLAAGQDCTDEREHDDETTLHDHDYDHEQEREQDISAWY